LIIRGFDLLQRNDPIKMFLLLN